MNTKKSLVILLLSVLFFASCSSTRNTMNEYPIEIQKFDRDEYVVLDNVEGEAKSTRFWLLFLPFGGKSEAKLGKEAYERAVNNASNENADGLLQPRYTYKKTVIPLLLFNFSTKKVTAKGKAFRIKNEEEYQKSKGK